MNQEATEHRSIRSIKIGDEIYHNGNRGIVAQITQDPDTPYLTENGILFSKHSVRVPVYGSDTVEAFYGFELVLDEERDAAYADQYLFGIRPYDFEQEEHRHHHLL